MPRIIFKAGNVFSVYSQESEGLAGTERGLPASRCGQAGADEAASGLRAYFSRGAPMPPSLKWAACPVQGQLGVCRLWICCLLGPSSALTSHMLQGMGGFLCGVYLILARPLCQWLVNQQAKGQSECLLLWTEYLCPPNPYANALTSSVMTFGGEAFGTSLGLNEIMRVGTPWWD